LAITPAFSPAWAESFDTRLSPSPLTDGTRINITGEGRALVQWDGNILSVSGNFEGLATNATTAALYDGPGIGIPAVNATLGVDNIAAIPEPGTMWLAAGGALLLLARLRRR